MIKLKDGSEVNDKRLGCIYIENTKRLQYPIMKLVGEKKKPRPYTESDEGVPVADMVHWCHPSAEMVAESSEVEP